MNSLNLSARERFFSIGIAPAMLVNTNVLTLSINEGGDGGDGWAVDFLTVGVTSSPVPKPGSVAILAGAGGVFLLRRRRAFH